MPLPGIRFRAQNETPKESPPEDVEILNMYGGQHLKIVDELVGEATPVIRITVVNSETMLISSGARQGTAPLPSGLEIMGREIVANMEYELPKMTPVILTAFCFVQIEIRGIVPDSDLQRMVLSPADTYMFPTRGEPLEILHSVAYHLGVQEKPEYRTVLVCGAELSGKSSFCDMILNYCQKSMSLGRAQPYFIELDPRTPNLSNGNRGGFPGSLTLAILCNVFDHDESKEILEFFYGHFDWTYKKPLFWHLIKCLAASLHTRIAEIRKANEIQAVSSDNIGLRGAMEMRGNDDGEGTKHQDAEPRLVVINAPHQATPDLLKDLIALFSVDDVVCMEDKQMYYHVATHLSEMRTAQPEQKPVSSIFLQKFPQLTQTREDQRKAMRTRRLHTYFYGHFSDLHPHSYPLFLDTIKLLEYKVSEEDVVSLTPFTSPMSHLVNCILAVVESLSIREEDDMTHCMPVAGYLCCLSVNEAEGSIQVVTPAPLPLPSNVLIVGETLVRDKGAEPGDHTH